MCRSWTIDTPLMLWVYLFYSILIKDIVQDIFLKKDFYNDLFIISVTNINKNTQDYTNEIRLSISLKHAWTIKWLIILTLSRAVSLKPGKKFWIILIGWIQLIFNNV